MTLPVPSVASSVQNTDPPKEAHPEQLLHCPTRTPPAAADAEFQNVASHISICSEASVASTNGMSRVVQPEAKSARAPELSEHVLHTRPAQIKVP